ncbi:hypothetical protein [Alkaliphilus crotonatoxidans]
MFILSGILAAFFAYLLNKVILKRFGGNSLIMIVPLAEELIKTLAAMVINRNILATHIVFGIIEGGYDIFNSPKKIGKLAALASILSHSLFGYITLLVFNRSQSIFIAILVAWLFHSGWNWYITKYL